LFQDREPFSGFGSAILSVTSGARAFQASELHVRACMTIEQPSKPATPRPPDPIDKPPPDIKPVPPPDIPPPAPDIQPPTFPERGDGDVI
jgi:hypothetical protein